MATLVMIVVYRQTLGPPGRTLTHETLPVLRNIEHLVLRARYAISFLDPAGVGDLADTLTFGAMVLKTSWPGILRWAPHVRNAVYAAILHLVSLPNKPGNFLYHLRKAAYHGIGSLLAALLVM